jgi:hypothetical protein
MIYALPWRKTRFLPFGEVRNVYDTETKRTTMVWYQFVVTEWRFYGLSVSQYGGAESREAAKSILNQHLKNVGIRLIDDPKLILML